jgi:hypothetical protein
VRGGISENYVRVRRETSIEAENHARIHAELPGKKQALQKQHPCPVSVLGFNTFFE